MSEKKTQPTTDEMEEREVNPARYREMSVPHADGDAGIKAFKAFYAEVQAARVRHRICDVHIIGCVKALSQDGQEGEMLLSLHCGDPMQAERMAAFAYGYQKKEREELIASALDGGKKRR